MVLKCNKRNRIIRNETDTPPLSPWYYRKKSKKKDILSFLVSIQTKAISRDWLFDGYRYPIHNT